MLEWPKLHEEYLDKAKMEKWEHFIAIRGEITKVLENARREKTIGHSLDAKVDLYATGEAYELFEALGKGSANPAHCFPRLLSMKAQIAG